MIYRSSISRFLNNREIKDPQTNRYICRLYGFTRSKCWLASRRRPLGFVRHAFISLQLMRDEQTPKDVCGEAKCWPKTEKIV